MQSNVIILAGGISSRMNESAGENSKIKPKTMTGIGKANQPFLNYLLFNIEKAGFQNAVLLINEKDLLIKNYYLNNKNLFPSLKITFATQQIPSNRLKPLGTADALLQTLNNKTDWHSGSFVVCNSDNLYSKNAFRTLLKSNYDNAMISYNIKGLEFDESRIKLFSVLKKDSLGFLEDIIEKPESLITDERGNVFAGMNIFKLKYSMIYPYLVKCPLNPKRDEKELPEAVKLMINENPRSLFCYDLSEHVPDLTSKKDIQKVQEYISRHFNSNIRN